MVLILSEEQVETAVSAMGAWRGAIDSMEQALRSYGRGEVALGDRIGLFYPQGRRGERRQLGIHSAMLPGLDAAGLRAFGEGQPECAESNHVILLFRFSDMALQAIIADHRLQVFRVGAPVGVAARHLARPAAQRVGVLGSSRHARGQLAAICAACPVQSARVFSPTPAHREAYAREMTTQTGILVEPVPDPEQAVRGADIVAVATDATSPALRSEWIEPGMHISSTGESNEIDPAIYARVGRDVRLVVSARERMTPRFAAIIERGALDRAPETVEIGEVLVGAAAGRTSTGEITLYHSPGIAVFDVAIGAWVYQFAREHGLGTELSLGAKAPLLAAL